MTISRQHNLWRSPQVDLQHSLIPLTSRDPIGWKGRQYLLYGYVKGRSTTAVDPSGYQQTVPVGPLPEPPWIPRIAPGTYPSPRVPTGTVCKAVAGRACLYISVFVTFEQCGEFVADYTTVPLCENIVYYHCSDDVERIQESPPIPENEPGDEPEENACTKAGYVECPNDLKTPNRLQACRECNPGVKGIQPGRPEDPYSPWPQFMEEFPQKHYSCKLGKGDNRTSIVCGHCCRDIMGIATFEEGCICAYK